MPTTLHTNLDAPTAPSESHINQDASRPRIRQPALSVALPRFIVMLSDPVERAVRHWRSLTAALARGSGSSGGGGDGSGGGGSGSMVGAVGPVRGALSKEFHHQNGNTNANANKEAYVSREAQYLAGYTNGSKLVNKLRSESAALQQCLSDTSRINQGHISVETWQR